LLGKVYRRPIRSVNDVWGTFLDIAEGLGLGVAALEKIGIKDVSLG